MLFLITFCVAEAYLILSGLLEAAFRLTPGTPADMASLVTIFAAFIAISIISAGSAAVIPLASRVIPGIDSPPAFVASCQPSDIIYYNIWDQLFIFNITTNGAL
jgi:hypothetical protein